MLKEESTAIYIVATLKDLLRLFDENALLEDFEIGDTWHPASGYVDQRIFSPNPPVKEILADLHDWKGLVVFDCRIGELRIQRVSETKERTVYEFRIEGPFKTRLKLYHLLIEKDALEPGVYDFS